MRPGALLLATIVLALPEVAGAATPEGEWWTPGLKARVRIAACGAGLCGKVSWLLPRGILPPGEEPLPELAGRSVFVMSPDPARPGHFRGRIDNPEDGNRYEGAIVLHGKDWLEVKGCLFFICRSQLWLRHWSD
ncbi:MAG: DUF2147 domain-containing protein [Alphaproteobacteria bacterium]|nr:DUF2147 domain-containing protein [Alphaproteobacteria bacterium]